MEYSTAKSEIPSLVDDVIISIQPVHAERLYKGEKVFELRKSIPRIVPRRIFLYETNGVKGVRGHIIVERVLSGSPESLWRTVGNRATSKIRFDEYFHGRSIAFAFEVGEAVVYQNPIKLEEMSRIQPGFRPSQNFLYLQNFPALKKHLQEIAMRESFNFGADDCRLTPLDSSVAATQFVAMVENHISDSYLETGRRYGEKLIELDRLGKDPEGIFTRKKTIKVIMHGEQVAGFTVLTEKLGGTIKTGPTMILDEFKRKGVGAKMRRVLHRSAHRAGFRKVYCTAPVANEPACRYLIATGCRIEAHLRRQYHKDHDELVFGFPLSMYRGPAQEFARPTVLAEDFLKLSRCPDSVIDFISEEFGATYFEVPREWALAQARGAESSAKARTAQFKERVLFTASGTELSVVTLCSVKRGGSCKLLLLTRTGHRRSLQQFIAFIEKELGASRKWNCRKFYSHVPLQDVDTLQSFLSSGYQVEGVLERPYNETTDFVVVGKLLGK